MIQSADEFAQLRRSEDPSDYQRASNDEAPLDVWLEVIERFADLREWVVHNKTVPLAVLELLAVDLDPRVRAAVAVKRTLPPRLQSILSTDGDASVRQRLAHNAKCELSVLRLLAQDSEEFVRTAAEKILRKREAAL